MVSFGNKNKAVVLKALWENSKAQGMSFLALPELGQITVEQCSARLAESAYVDYFAGKVIKIDFSGGDFNPWGYDRDNGQGAAQKAVDSVL